MLTTAPQSAIEVMEQVKTAAVAKAKPDPVRYGSMAPGDYHRQGDVYVTRLAALPAGTKPIVKPAAQLAPGETQGSRHTLDNLRGIKQHELPQPTPLDGPIIETKREFTVLHPEHGHVTFPPGIYHVTYQRQYADELRRVQD